MNKQDEAKKEKKPNHNWERSDKEAFNPVIKKFDKLLFIRRWSAKQILTMIAVEIEIISGKLLKLAIQNIVRETVIDDLENNGIIRNKINKIIKPKEEKNMRQKT